MTYGILASQSCLLTKIAHALQEKTKKAYTVDRLSDHLKDGINDKAMAAYLNDVRKMVPSEPVVHIDDSDVIKPDGYHFEALGTVRDGSKSTTKKCVYAKGYYITEACVLTDSNHPASIYSRIHSSHEKGFTSVNHITFEAIDRSVKLLKNATFVMDRGYDDNKISKKLWGLEQDFVIRLTQKRKLFFHRKWVHSTKLCAERKGKVKMTRKAAANTLLKSVLDAARSIKDTVHFLYYRISYGIAEILKYARVGIRDWFKPKRTDQNQLRFRLSA